MRKRDCSFRLLVLPAVFASAICLAQTPAPRALVLDGPGPWRDARWTLGVTEFASLLNDAGYQVNTVSPMDLPSAAPKRDVLLAVPSLESLPLASFKAVAAFVAAGGSLMASGGEPFRAPLYLTADGKWLDGNSLLQTLAPATTILDPVTATLSPVVLVPQTVTRSTVTGPDGQSKALDLQLTMPASQYYLLTAPLAKPVFNAGQTATILWTRGTPGQSMLFEWDETDGSRWIATVPLTAQWTKQVLLPREFHYLAGATARASTTFNPAQASGLYFGVSTSGGAMPGALEFALSAIGAAAAPALESFTVPVLETLSPSYKQYATQRGGQTVRVPITRGRGLMAASDPDGRYRALGDPLSPAATWYVTNQGTVTIWLPWPQLQDPERAPLVTLLSALPNRLFILNAGPTEIVVLPSEDVILGARVINSSQSPAQASLNWSIWDSTGTAVAQFPVTLNLDAGQLLTVPATDAGPLPSGDYAVTASLLLGDTEVDRVDTRVRVFDPTLTYQPDQRIIVANGAFATADGTPLFLQGVNYWPRYTAGLEPARFIQSWLLPQNYDPDAVEADLALIASLNFNLVSFQFYPYGGPEQGRSLVDFLDRCRNHGIWANIYIQAFVPGAPPAILMAGQPQRPNPNIASMLQAALLPGNDRVFAYDLLWEPRLGAHNDRLVLDNAWRAWITDQYGSPANAEKLWGFTAPRDAQNQLSNPLDTQMTTDGAWRVMVAAYRRFADDFLGRSLGVAARTIRATAPGTLLSFRNGWGSWINRDNLTMAYDLGLAAAHVDFVSSEAYGIPPWPEGRAYGFGSAYGRYRSGGKPVYWAEYGFNIGANGGTPQSRANQSSTTDAVMRLVNEDGSAAASVWWLVGWEVDASADYGILNSDGSPRDSALLLAKWGAAFAATPPTQGSGAPVSLTIDRDADARGQYGLFLNLQNDYVQAKQAGRPVILRDTGTGTDTSTMPLVQVGNVPYAGSGPLKYANGEFDGIRVQCPGLNATVENGAQIQVPAGSTCQITPSLVNTGSAAWLPTAQSTAGVVLHTNLGDLPLQNSIRYLQRGDVSPLQVTAGQSNIDITGRLNIQGIGGFGETLHVTLAPQ